MSWTLSVCPPSAFTVEYALIDLEQCDQTRVGSIYGSDITDSGVMLTGLLPGSQYEVTVSAMLTDGGTTELKDTWFTSEAGKYFGISLLQLP